MPRPVTIKVFDREYSVESDLGDQEMRDIARYVDEKIREVMAITRNASTQNLAILAALNIARDYYLEKSGVDRIRAEFDEKCEALIREIERTA